MKADVGSVPEQTELSNAAVSTLELIRACGEVVHASWLPLRSTIACQEQFLGNLFSPRRNARRREAQTLAAPDKRAVRALAAAVTAASAPGKGDPAVEENAAASDELCHLAGELARLRAVNAELNAELARQQRVGEPAGWREFIELTAGSGCGVANGVTIASLARKLLASTEHTRKVLLAQVIPADEVS